MTLYPRKRSTAKPKARKPIRKVRRKARPGRLKGKAMTELRMLAFIRDEGICQMQLDKDCTPMLDWETFELAHKRNKRMWGDSLEQVICACRSCHRKSHNAGGKPCPPKPKEGRA